MIAIRLLVALGGLGLTALIVLSLMDGDFWNEGSQIWQMLWGKTTLADLYLGFVISAIFILFSENTIPARLFWIVPIFFLGNVWTALWLVIRLPRIAQALLRS